jgi:hypothetical protein
MTDKPVRRFISKFRRGTDSPLEEIALTNVPLATLQAIFQKPSEDLMYASYDIDENHARALQPFVAEPIDLKAYEYFLEAEEL